MNRADQFEILKHHMGKMEYYKQKAAQAKDQPTYHKYMAKLNEHALKAYHMYQAVGQPFLQFNPQLHAQLQFNPHLQVNPHTEINPQTQAYFNFDPELNINIGNR